MSLVLDASAAVAWLFTMERNDDSRRLLRRVASDGAVVPSLWRLEVANVLRNAVRRQRCDDAYADRSLRRLALLRVISDSETDSRAWTDTRLLSRDQGLTVYEAAYLELALRRKLPLASRDAAVLAAAGRRGVALIAA
jgi:predicted nucleic acid-binding protein